MNITDNLIRIKEGKENIIQSLKNKGVSIDDNTLINEIPTIIDNAEIGGGGGDTPSQPETPELTPKYEGATVFRINVPEDNYEFAINLCNDPTKATYDVDWGDGSLESGLTTDEQHHTYSKAGIYDVNIYNLSNNITLGGNFTDTYEIGYTQYYRKFIYFLFNNSSNDFWSGTYIENKDYIICTNILIGKGIYTFGNYTFTGCTSLQSVVMSNSITSVGNNAFDGCISLQRVVIPNSVKSIGNYAFKDCTLLQSIVIPESVTSIGQSAFKDCTSLQSIVIPETIKSIGTYVFDGCTSLQSIVIPKSVTSIGQNVFTSCTSLQSVVIPETIKSIGGQAFSDCSSLTSVTIPNSVTSIESYAFSKCSSLQNIIIPESVKTLKYESFNTCTSLQSIVIPNSVTTIDGGCFNNCFSLQEIICNGLTAPTIQSSSFPTSNLKYSKRYLYVPKESTGYEEEGSLWKTNLIDKGWELRYIEDKPEKTPTTLKLKTTNNFFHNLQAIGQANLIDYKLINNEYVYNFDDKITELHQYTFYKKVLEEIELPEGLEIIGNYTFQNCSSLQSVNIPNSVTSIGEYSFSNCYSLQSIVIPDSVTTIRNYAFQNCSKLSTITCKAMTAPTIQSNTFQYIASSGTRVLRIPEGSSGYEETTSGWYKQIISKGYTVEYITE